MLTSGTVVDRYEIQEVLGAGGMAVVYKAVHRELRSEHAVKILKVPRGPVLDRLMKEGQAQANLRHPNIVAVTDVIRLEGATALVMELVKGPTLDHYLANEQLSVEQLDHLAKGILSGVTAAHDMGTVHRDLKPGNILLDIREGLLVPKITDFGLVKVLDGEDRGLSVTGTGLGTPSYMSPEQIQNAKHVDHRADIFSLGCVLYEMVCGRRAFEGPSMFETFSLITQGKYTPVRALRPDVPDRIERAIQGALALEPEKRIADCRTLQRVWLGGSIENPTDTWDAAAIERAKNIARQATEEQRSKATYGAISIESADVKVADQGPPTVVTTERTPTTGPSYWIVGGMTVGLLGGTFAATAIALNVLAGPVPASDVAAEGLKGTAFEQLTFDHGIELNPVLSPDGREVAYVDGVGRLVTQRLGSAKVQSVFGEGIHASEPSFLPDGRSLVFVRDDAGGARGIWIVDAGGGQPRRLFNGGYSPRVSPDGKWIAFSTVRVHNPMVRTQMSSIEVASLDSPESIRELAEADAVDPTWSPNGKRLAFWRFNGGERELWTVRADGDDAKHVDTGTRTHWSPVWTHRGIFYISDHEGLAQVWRVRVDEETGEALAPAQAVTGVAGQSMWHMSATPDGGRIAWVAHAMRSRVMRLTLDLAVPKVTERLDIARGRHLERPDVSPDGKRVAMMSYGEQEDLYTADIDGESLDQVTDDKHRDRSPRWSPDGQRLAFFSNRHGIYQLYTIRADGSELKRHTEMDEYMSPVWSPNGDALIAHSEQMPYLVRLQGGIPELVSERHLTIYDWSKDGTHLAGWEDGKGTFLLEPRLEAEPVQIADFDALPRFLSDGKRMLLATDLALMLYDPDRKPALSPIFQVEAPDTIAGLAVAPDDSFAVVSITKQEGDLWSGAVQDPSAP